MEGFTNENVVAEHHYARRLISTSFGHWIQLVSENARINESSMAKAESFLRRKSRRSPYPPEQSLAVRRAIFRWMSYCNNQLKHRGQYMLGRIARQKLLVAKGYRRLRQFYVDEISMRKFGISRPLSTGALSMISDKFIHSKSKEMQRKFMRILRQKCLRKALTRRNLCRLQEANSPRLRTGHLALNFLATWRKITRQSNDSERSFRRAIRHNKEVSLWTAFGKRYAATEFGVLAHYFTRTFVFL